VQGIGGVESPLLSITWGEYQDEPCFLLMRSEGTGRKVAMKAMSSFSQSRAYNQEAFRYLLKSESKRSERSGRLYQILLVYWTDVKVRIVPMDSQVAKTVMAALPRSLRETDYIGWYCDGHIVGAVLTVLAEESMAQVASHLQKRLAEILQLELSVAEGRRLQIRVCLPDELEGIELGEKPFAVS
jgi:hypothetical protein